MVSRSDVVKISIADYSDEIEFAIFTADKKSKRSNTANTWQKGRGEFKKFTDLFPGDLAKNMVRAHAKNQKLELNDYDKIRTDNFRYQDRFDLMFNNKKIEVKSSLEKINNSAYTLLNKRRFMVYADREVCDLIVQVYFVYESNEGKDFFHDIEKTEEAFFRTKYNINSKEEFVKQFISHSPSALIMGFITRNMVKENKKELFNFSDRKVAGDQMRSYVNIFIKEGIPFSEFVKQLNL